MGDLSEHFSRSEFICHGQGKRGHRTHVLVVNRDLLALLERVRERVGKPVRIVSGHRCALHNGQVGGAGGSMHVVGRAADLPPGLLYTFDAIKLGATGVGSKGPWAVHVDVRSGPLKLWTY